MQIVSAAGGLLEQGAGFSQVSYNPIQGIRQASSREIGKLWDLLQAGHDTRLK